MIQRILKDNNIGLTYAGETWMMAEKCTIQMAEMKFLRLVKGYWPRD